MWFRKWVLGKQSLSDIAAESGYSERQLRRWFAEYLDNVPSWTIRRRSGLHILIDGTWLDRDHCVIVYRDADNKSTLFYRFASDENQDEIIKDLEAFKAMKLKISSFTTDVSEPIIRAIKYAYPHKTRQRCTVHIERECLSWLTQHPKSSGGILLR
ncbi:MAG: hypothetical protein J6X25_09590, partial [Bacteroidales bacterium]|nr:hypothetical protein [Bacteroidales bacterium]